MLLGHQKGKKRELLFSSLCKSKNVDDYECKTNPAQMHFPPPLFFPPALFVECGGLFILAASSSFLPGAHFSAASAICPSAFQYLGTWHFRAVVSRKEADVLKFQAMDSMWFYMEEADNDTLLTTGHMRV